LKIRKRKYGNKRYFYINLHLKDHLDTEFTGWPRLVENQLLTQIGTMIGYGLRDHGIQNGGCCRSKRQ